MLPPKGPGAEDPIMGRTPLRACHALRREPSYISHVLRHAAALCSPPAPVKAHGENPPPVPWDGRGLYVLVLWRRVPPGVERRVGGFTSGGAQSASCLACISRKRFSAICSCRGVPPWSSRC